MTIREALRPVCSHCGWSDVRQSRSEGLGDFLAAMLLLRPVRCRKCRSRFYRPWFIAAWADKIEADHPFPIALAPKLAIAAPGAIAPVPFAPTGSILLLDEDRALRRILARLLRRDGFVIREAEYSRDAMRQIEAGGVDLLIANLHREQSAQLRDFRDAYPALKILELAEAGVARASVVVDRARELLRSPSPVQ